MTAQLAGKTAFATASGAGIGRATALAMAQAGARVFATDVDAAALETLAREAEGLALETFVLDALDGDAIRAATERVTAAAGAPDILFNCTGFVHQGTILEADDAAYDRSFDLNVKAHFRIIRAVLPGMLAKGGGSIIAMASAVGVHKGAPNRCVYAATKAAVIGLTKSVAADYIGRGIRANAICPGSVETPSLEQRMRDLGGDYGAVRQAFIDRAPMGRMARADEIAGLAVYLASDAAAFITGETLLIDGGWSL